MPDQDAAIRWRRARQCHGRVGTPAERRKRLMRTAAPASLIWLLGTSAAVADTAAGAVSAAATGVLGLSLSSAEVINFALVIGAVSAAMTSAIWLIRERHKTEAENIELRSALGESRARLSRYGALLGDKDRRIVVWDGKGAAAEILGSLPMETGAPEDESAFLAFDRWLQAASAAELDDHIGKLRLQAQRFDAIVEAVTGHVFEVQGRVSGGRAFVRFAAIAGERAELAARTLDCRRLADETGMFKHLLEAGDMPAWTRAGDGRLAWVNQAYVVAVEATDAGEAVAGQVELLTSATRDAVRAHLRRQRAYADTVSTVAGGDRRLFRVVEVRGEDGSAGIAIDVSAAGEAREELNRTLRSYADTLEHLTVPVAIFDRHQRLQFFNQAFQRLWALDTPFLESRPDNGEFLERLRSEGKLPEPHSWRDWKETMLSVYRAVDPQPHIWHLPNGHTLNVLANAHPQGGATWVFDDLTEKVDLEARYNTLLKVQGETIDHLAEGVAVFGADGKLRLSNPAFRALWGITEADAAVGTHVRALAEACRASDPDGNNWGHFGDVITSFDDERRSHGGRIELASGLVLDYALVPLPNAQTMLAFVDMSDSVRVERALTQMNEALRRADALKNDFVQHVSYELRSPLTNIIGFTDLLKTPSTGPLTERQREYVEHISTSSAILLTIVNDILDLATVDAGIMKLDVTEVDLSATLAEVAEQVSGRLKESRLTLDIEVDTNPGILLADAQRLKQILVKLLGNAANFAPQETTIRLTVRREGGDVVFAVSDEGPGIPEDVRASVFDRFATHGQGRRRGAGLGLSIVESFVSLHGGSVSIDGAAAGGTTVVCRIPAVRPDRAEAAE